jgi:hypothetical protein
VSGFNHVGLSSGLEHAIVEYAPFRVSMVGGLVLLVFVCLFSFFDFLFFIFGRIGSISVLISGANRKGPGANNPPAGCCPRRAATVDERLQGLELSLNGSLFASRKMKQKLEIT